MLTFFLVLCGCKVVIIPIIFADQSPEEVKELMDYSTTVLKAIKARGVRTQMDKRDNYTAGWKYNHWEQKVRRAHHSVPPL